MIKNCGILWQRKYVHFGAGRNKGTLLGRRRKSFVVDFREQIGIYVLFDGDLSPIYVGQAGNGNADLFKRLRTHTRDHLWNRWEYFSWFGLRRVNPGNKELSDYDSVEKRFKESGKIVLDDLEGVLIAAMEPKLNKQGPKFREAKQYDQAIDENVRDVTLGHVHEQIEALRSQLDKLATKPRHRN